MEIRGSESKIKVKMNDICPIHLSEEGTTIHQVVKKPF